MPIRSRPPAAAFATVALVAAMLLGGSGSLVPLPEMVLECLLAAVTAAWVWLRPNDLRHVPRSAWIIAALLVALPLCQLLPLPPAVWQSLPGRSVEKAALDLIGQGASWRPWSETPNRTLAALLAMMAPAAVLIMAAAQDRRGRALLLATMAAIALLSVLVGAAQLSGGAGNPFRFYNPAETFLDGFQTNHNAQADVLLIGMVALAAAAHEFTARRRPAMAHRRPPTQSPRLLPAMVGGATLLLILGVILTASRTGIALLPIAMGTQALILRRWLHVGKRHLAMVAVAALALFGVGLAAASGHHGALGKVWDRFHTPNEFRPQIWHDAVFALRQVWPWGSGMGSFIPIFAAAERLEVVTSKFVNRAHDDYLEFLIEAGFPGVLVFGLICGCIVRDAWRLRFSGRQAQLFCGAASLLLVALHSLGDYPLRTLSIACMVAVDAALLLPIAGRGGAGVGNNDEI